MLLFINKDRHRQFSQQEQRINIYINLVCSITLNYRKLFTNDNKRLSIVMLLYFGNSLFFESQTPPTPAKVVAVYYIYIHGTVGHL